MAALVLALAVAGCGDSASALGSVRGEGAAGSGGAHPTVGASGGAQAYECFGDGRYHCADGTVTRSIFGAGTRDPSGCEPVVLRCESGCAAESAPSTDSPASLCNEWGAPPPACPADPYHGVEDEPLPPSEIPASAFGCRGTERELAPESWNVTGTPACAGMVAGCTYAPSALPCGACTDEPACSAGVWATCDRGQGPFLDRYWDSWLCRCENGNWDCRISAPSGASCFYPVDAGAP